MNFIKTFILSFMIGLTATSNAQQVNGSATLTWVLPTTSIEGLGLTATNALTEVQVFLSTSPIADTSTALPTVTLGAGVTNTIYTMSVANGSTIYARIKACNKPSTTTQCSAFTTQVSKVVNASTVPGVPTSVTISVTITP